jgi:hypothetical protein
MCPTFFAIVALFDKTGCSAWAPYSASAPEMISISSLVIIGLELVGRAAERRRRVGVEFRRNDLLRGRNLRDHRTEARVEQRADVETELVVQRDDLLGDHLGVLEAQRAHRAQIDHLDDLFFIGPPQLIEAFAADAEQFDLFALGDERIGALAGKPHDRRIERPAQAALGGAHQQKMRPVAAAAAQQPRRRIETRHGSGDVAQDLVHVGRIGPRRFGGGLRATQLRRRHHLHGAGNLLRRLGGGDAIAQVLERRHLP